MRGAASGLQVTRVSSRTAVLRVRAADRPGGGAAAPLCGRDLTAGLLFGAVKLPPAVTHCLILCGRHGLRHFALRDGAEEHIVALLLTGSYLHVAGVALRAAVLMVGTANRLEQRAAAPLSRLQLTAGRTRRAAALVVTFNINDGAQLG